MRVARAEDLLALAVDVPALGEFREPRVVLLLSLSLLSLLSLVVVVVVAVVSLLLLLVSLL